MAYYRICPHCGARLDPGERCECEHEKSPSPAATSREAKRNIQGQYTAGKKGLSNGTKSLDWLSFPGGDFC